MSDFLRVKEIYKSIQGESTWAGLPCVFVRLSGCHLRCSYCDSVYAFTGGDKMTVDQVVRNVESFTIANPSFSQINGYKAKLPLVEITGGEPLIQAQSLKLMDSLVEKEYTVLLETSGALPINEINQQVHIIMDIKCPSSGESEKNLLQNLECIGSKDEIKFVCGTLEDLDFVERMIRDYQLDKRTGILVSWVSPLTSTQKFSGLKSLPEGVTPISRLELVETIMSRNLPVRFQLQMHKFIWPADKAGV